MQIWSWIWRGAQQLIWMAGCTATASSSVLCRWGCCELIGLKHLLVLSQLPVGSIRVDWHRVSITLTRGSLGPSLILFSCWAVSLAYCTLPHFTFQWGIPCCNFRCIFLRGTFIFDEELWYAHESLDGKWSWAVTELSQTSWLAYLQDWRDVDTGTHIETPLSSLCPWCLH